MKIIKNHRNKGDILINNNISDTIFIDIYEIVNDELYILANTFKDIEDDVEAYVNGNLIEINELKFPQRKKYSNFSFETRISLSKDIFHLEFKSKKFNKTYNLDFSRPCNFSKIVGYSKTKHYLSVLNDDNTITIKPKTTFEWIKKEIKAQFRMLKNRDPGYKVGIPFRIAYMLGYPFLKNKKIWFFMDLPTIADDNGMHLFKYYMENDLKKDVKKYFILSSDSKDYNEMKKVGKVISYKSLKHRYLGMFAENIITSHPDNGIIYPFWGTYPHFAGLLKSNTIFLQHGVTKDDITYWLNKFSMNLTLFVTCSPKEYESIFQYPYNYDEDIVQLLGFPRFDNLKNEKNEKRILIMPSWRRYLTNETKENISKTEFFKRFNSLINNERLIDAAKEYGYEIIFRPHPNVYEFIDLFDENDYVKIDYEQGKYQDLFNKGSILITDYSSVAFDFAYLYKPVVYYHYSDDYHFTLDSFYDYETMGFGEIEKDEEELVNTIIEYIKNDCEIKEEYSNRIKEFFLYTDKNNCKRVSEAINKLPLKD